MPSYFYKAKKESAESVTGYITANDSDEAIEIVSDMGLLPIEVEEATVDGALLKKIRSRKIKSKELYVFTRQLASLLKSGLPLLRALEVLLRQTRNKYFSSVLAVLIVEIRNGRAFSEALSDYPHIFSPLYISMVHAGEESSQLAPMIQSLAEDQKTQLSILSKVRAALAYPVLMALVGVATIIFILSYVMPKVSVLFTSVSEDLPWPTQVVMMVSQAVQNYWYWGVFVFLAIVLTVRVFGKTSAFRAVYDDIVLQMPFIRGVIVKIEMERFCRTLRLLLANGVPIIKAIKTSTPTVSNGRIRKELLLCQTELSEGGSFGIVLSESDLIPDLIGELIAVGEETGSLEESLGDVSEAYQQDIDELTKSLTSLLEPIMILVVGLVVGFIVFAMLLPIFQMDVVAR